MKKSSPKILYDKESQVLSWQLKKGKSVDSDIQGNVVIDYNRAGKIVRINFYHMNFEDFKEHKKDFQRFVSARQMAIVS